MKTGWQTRKLADVCQFSNGLWKGEKPPFVNVGVIRNTNFTKDGTLDDSDIAYLHVEAKKFEKRRLQFGDVILEKSGGGPKQPVGRVVLFDKTEGDFSFSNFTSALRVLDPDSLDFRFLHKFLHWIYISGVTEGMQSHSTGIRNLDADAYKLINISFPSISEQRHIVGILDAAFEGIATAKTNAEKNLLNARALFESYLNNVFTRRGDGWVEKTLSETCIVERGSSPRPIKNFFTSAPNGVNWIKIGDTVEGEKYIYSTKQKITPEGAKQSRLVKENDFILTNSMSFGRPYIMRISGYIHDGWFVLRLKDSVDLDYFYYLLASSFVQSQFKSLASGAIVLNISSDLVKQAKLPIPPLIEQQALAQKFRDYSDITKQLESIYRRKLAALDELKKSLLHRAFTGDLPGPRHERSRD